MSQPILSINDLTICFPAKQAQQTVLSHFHLDLYAGQCVGLVGESGSGKTLAGLSMLQLLPHGALVSAQSQIYFQEQDLLLLPEKQMRLIRGHRISMIFQDALSAFNPVLTVGFQIDEVLRLHLGLSKKQARVRSIELLDSVGIKNPSGAYQSYPHQLSGGMRQRAMIAMAVASEPAVLIADEPTTALDVTIQAQVLELLQKLQQEKSCALLFIGHDLSVVSQMADEIVVLEKGITVEHAKTKQFFTAPTQDYSKKLLSAVLPSRPRQKAPESITGQLLSVDHLSVSFGKTKAVNAVSFDIQKGETVALVGESGSGKTTTAKALLRLVKQQAGGINFQGHDVPALSRRPLRQLRSKMQLIFQDPAAALNPRMLVSDSLAEGLLIQRLATNRKTAMSLVDDILQKVGLSPEMKSRYPHEFSGGQKQRLCIARALALAPELLVLDEPTSALDVSIQKQILDLLVGIQAERQLSYLLITHNLSVVAYMAHRVLVMYQGQIVEQGSVQDVLTAPNHPYTKQLIAAMPTMHE